MRELVARLAVRIRVVLERLGIRVSDEQVVSWILRAYRRLLFWIPVILVYALLLLVVALWNIFGDPFTVFGEKHRPGTMMLYALLLYTAASLRIIGPTELGCRLFFGKPIDNVSSGLTFVPLWIFELSIETANVIQDELPAEPDKIYRGSVGDEKGETVPPQLQALGFKPPIRITFSGHNKASEDPELEIPEDDPYDQRLTAEVVPVIRWRIKDYAAFLRTIGDIENARRQMEDTCVKTFTQRLTKVSPAVALRRMKEYGGELEEALDEVVQDSWGIDVMSAEIKAINFSRDLNKAVQRVVEEERNKMASIFQGQGLGGKEQAILDGRTAGLENMKKKLKIDGEVVIGAETARAIAGEGEKSSQRTIIVGASGFADLIGAATAIGEGLKTKRGGTQ